MFLSISLALLLRKKLCKNNLNEFFEQLLDKETMSNLYKVFDEFILKEFLYQTIHENWAGLDTS